MELKDYYTGGFVLQQGMEGKQWHIKGLIPCYATQAGEGKEGEGRKGREGCSAQHGMGTEQWYSTPE